MLGMDDGRFLTDYRPSCMADAQLMKDNHITSNSAFRNFLQNNAVSLMEQQMQTDIDESKQALQLLPCACSDCNGPLTSAALGTNGSGWYASFLSWLNSMKGYGTGTGIGTGGINRTLTMAVLWIMGLFMVLRRLVVF